MHKRRFHGSVGRLRAPDRVARMEVERVANLCLEGIAARSVLDVGTGTGLFAEAFVARGLEVTGIDQSAEMIEAAQRLVPAAQFRQASAGGTPYEDCAFDLVFLGLILHEVDDESGVLREARRLARLRAAVLEWPYREQEHGPPLAGRLEPGKVAALAQKVGFHSSEECMLEHLVLYRLG